MAYRKFQIVSLATMLTFHAGQSFATGSIACSGMNDDISVRLVLGAGPVPTIIQAEARLGEISHSTVDANQPAFIARSFVDDESIKIDLVDDQASHHLVQLRIVRSFDGNTEGLQVGFAKMKSKPPMAVTCDGP
jgi:hypothetical protein